jgi:2-polyprenyl-3-methyl-5-hydroxy-6-metoxy-1,4-benzoquinol methylase
MLLAIAKKISRKIKATLRALRRLLIAEQTLTHLQVIRDQELGVVAALLPLRGRLLEIGAGTGWQAQALAKRGLDVSAVDVPSSNYADDRAFPVIDYDGHTLPFEDGEFDVVYSSNLLEHIPHLHDFQREIHRVLKPQGYVIHVLPSSAWRFWTNLTHIVKYLSIPTVHGEHAKNAIFEISAFSCRSWRRIFCEAGWLIVSEHSNHLFYTGNSIFDSKLDIKTRKILSRLLGGSCNIFLLRESR